MERFGFDADQTFTVLSRIASQTDRTLFDVAGEIVRTRRVPRGPADPEA